MTQAAFAGAGDVRAMHRFDEAFVLIVDAAHAGVQLAAQLRQQNFFTT